MNERVAIFTYAGRPVPIRPLDGYVNITALCEAEGKRAHNLLRSKDFKQWLETVSEKTQIRVISLVESRQKSGTWAHPDIAIWVAQCLSHEARYFVVQTLKSLHLAGVVTELGERELATQVASAVEARLDARRRRAVPPWLRRMHLQCAGLYYAGRCPGCREQLTEPEIDHFWAVNDNQQTSTWPLCRSCNRTRALPQTAKQRAAMHGAFELYQENLAAFRKTVDAGSLEDLPLFSVPAAPSVPAISA